MVDRSENASFATHQMAHGVLISDVIIAIGKVKPSSMFNYLGLNLADSLVYSETHFNIYQLQYTYIIYDILNTLCYFKMI